MSDLNNDLRLVIDTGKVAFGGREVTRLIGDASAKAVVIAMKGKREIIEDMLHMCNISSIKVIRFNGNSFELGTLCGKPFAVNALAILDSGNSGILKEEYNQIR